LTERHGTAGVKSATHNEKDHEHDGWSASKLQIGVTHLLDIPSRTTTGAAGFDVSASEQITIAPRSRAIVGTGVKLVMPPKVYEDEQVVMYATLKGRSGLATRGIDVHQGTIDCDYRGEIKAIVINNTDTEFEIHAGDRIAQLIFGMALVPQIIQLHDAEHAAPTQRGERGFGSTGIGVARVAIEATDVADVDAVKAEIVVTAAESAADAV